MIIMTKPLWHSHEILRTLEIPWKSRPPGTGAESKVSHARRHRRKAWVAWRRRGGAVVKDERWKDQEPVGKFYEIVIGLDDLALFL